MRNIFGIIVALSSAGLVIIMAQMISEGLFPFRPDMDYSDPEVMTEWMSNLPNKAYIIVAISHGLAALIAGLVSSLVAGTG
ncbi:MAG: hypothetical protein WBO36_14345, partial [Saprospiraceae bacterium]